MNEYDKLMELLNVRMEVIRGEYDDACERDVFEDQYLYEGYLEGLADAEIQLKNSGLADRLRSLEQ